MKVLLLIEYNEDGSVTPSTVGTVPDTETPATVRRVVAATFSDPNALLKRRGRPGWAVRIFGDPLVGSPSQIHPSTKAAAAVLGVKREALAYALETREEAGKHVIKVGAWRVCYDHSYRNCRADVERELDENGQLPLPLPLVEPPAEVFRAGEDND